MRRINRAVTIGGVLALGMAGGVASPAVAAPGGATNWHVGVYNASGRALSEGEAAHPGDGLATFRFTTTPDTALLIDTQGSQAGNLLGDLTGETVTATFTVAGSEADQFTYYGEGAPTPAPTARLFFETSGAGGFDPAHYWWSNPVGFAQLGPGTFTLTATVIPGDWSDYNGQEGTTVQDGFAAAAAHVTGIGLSFGGGGFFENGVGSPDATLTLSSFTAG